MGKFKLETGGLAKQKSKEVRAYSSKCYKSVF